MGMKRIRDGRFRLVWRLRIVAGDKIAERIRIYLVEISKPILFVI